MRRAKPGTGRTVDSRHAGLKDAPFSDMWSYARGNTWFGHATARVRGGPQNRVWNHMRHGAPNTKDAESAGLSPSRLRFGVALIILWLIPFWALGPEIAHSLNGLSNPPSVAAVTTAIAVVQTVIGIFGFWVAGTEVKSIVKGSSMKYALGALWSMFIHGHVPGHDTAATDSN
jgi:hypothetical protein